MYILNFVPYGHHSNGQARCPLVGYTPDLPDHKCIPIDSFVPRSSNPGINIAGDFSTDYLRFGLFRREIWLSGTRERTEVTFGGAVERHVEFYGAGLAEELRSRYGRTRLHMKFGAEGVNPGWLVVDLNFALDIIPGVERPYALTVEATPYLGRFGIYFRFYRGRDYYNINFERFLRRLEVGYSFKWERRR